MRISVCFNKVYNDAYPARLRAAGDVTAVEEGIGHRRGVSSGFVIHGESAHRREQAIPPARGELLDIFDVP